MSQINTPDVFCVQKETGEHYKLIAIKKLDDTWIVKEADGPEGYVMIAPQEIISKGEKQWPMAECGNCKHKLTCLLDSRAKVTYEPS